MVQAPRTGWRHGDWRSGTLNKPFRFYSHLIQGMGSFVKYMASLTSVQMELFYHNYNYLIKIIYEIYILMKSLVLRIFQFHGFIGFLNVWMSGYLTIVPSLGLFSCWFCLVQLQCVNFCFILLYCILLLPLRSLFIF